MVQNKYVDKLLQLLESHHSQDYLKRMVLLSLLGFWSRGIFQCFDALLSSLIGPIRSFKYDVRAAVCKQTLQLLWTLVR